LAERDLEIEVMKEPEFPDEISPIKPHRPQYSYRASKAALNMNLKTAAIEPARRKPNAALIALHPGSVNSRLPQPFRGKQCG